MASENFRFRFRHWLTLIAEICVYRDCYRVQMQYMILYEHVKLWPSVSFQFACRLTVRHIHYSSPTLDISTWCMQFW